MDYIWLAFAGGAAAFAHCLGMCGPFALHLSAGARPLAALWRQLLWHAGKTCTYVFLGALAGSFGALVGPVASHPLAQDILAYAAGGLIILVGLRMLGLPPVGWRRGPASSSAGTSAASVKPLLATMFGHFFTEPSGPAALTLGVATGFLPCPIVLVGLALSVKSGSVAMGMATMAALGAGTMASLMPLGLAAHAARVRLRRYAPAVGGAVLVLLGLTTALRGTEVLHRALGCPMKATGMIPCQASASGATGSAPQYPALRENISSPAAPASSQPSLDGFRATLKRLFAWGWDWPTSTTKRDNNVSLEGGTIIHHVMFDRALASSQPSTAPASPVVPGALPPSACCREGHQPPCHCEKP